MTYVLGKKDTFRKCFYLGGIFGCNPPPFHGLGFRRLENVLFLLVKISGKSAIPLKNDATYVSLVKTTSVGNVTFSGNSHTAIKQ